MEMPAPASVRPGLGQRLNLRRLVHCVALAEAPAEKAAVANANALHLLSWSSEPAEALLAFPDEGQVLADKALKGQVGWLGAVMDGALDPG